MTDNQKDLIACSNILLNRLYTMKRAAQKAYGTPKEFVNEWLPPGELLSELEEALNKVEAQPES